MSFVIRAPLAWQGNESEHQQKAISFHCRWENGWLSQTLCTTTRALKTSGQNRPVVHTRQLLSQILENACLQNTYQNQAVLSTGMYCLVQIQIQIDEIESREHQWWMPVDKIQCPIPRKHPQLKAGFLRLKLFVLLLWLCLFINMCVVFQPPAWLSVLSGASLWLWHCTKSNINLLFLSSYIYWNFIFSQLNL